MGIAPIAAAAGGFKVKIKDSTGSTYISTANPLDLTSSCASGREFDKSTGSSFTLSYSSGGNTYYLHADASNSVVLSTSSTNWELVSNKLQVAGNSSLQVTKTATGLTLTSSGNVVSLIDNC